MDPNAPLRTVGLSVRTFNPIVRAYAFRNGLSREEAEARLTIGEVLAWSARDLLALRGFGEGCLQELSARLHSPLAS